MITFKSCKKAIVKWQESRREAQKACWEAEAEARHEALVACDKQIEQADKDCNEAIAKAIAQFVKGGEVTAEVSKARDEKIAQALWACENAKVQAIDVFVAVKARIKKKGW